MILPTNTMVTVSLEYFDSLRELVKSQGDDLEELRDMIKDNLGFDWEELERRDRARRGHISEAAIMNHFMRPKP